MKIKRIVTGLLALAVVLVIAVVAIPLAMDIEKLRGIIEAEAEKATGRKLIVAGDIDLDISLTPAIAIAVEDIRFANADWGSRPEMVSIRRLEIEVAILPLFSGDFQFKRLVVVAPDILLETDAEGRGNWEIAGAAEDETVPEGVPRAMAPPSFDNVVVRDAVVTYRDGRTGEAIQLRLARLEGHATGPTAPLGVSVEGSYNDVPFKVEGTLGSFEQLFGAGPFPVKLSGEAGGATLAIDDQFATLGQALAALSGGIASDSLNLGDLAPPGAEPAPAGAGEQRYAFTEDPLPFEGSATVRVEAAPPEEGARWPRS